MEHSQTPSPDWPERPRQLQSWGAGTRFVFRFSFLYLGLYALTTQVAGSLALPGQGFHGLGLLWPLRELTFRVAEYAFGLAPPLVYEGNSRDTAFHWVQVFWLLVLAAILTAVWSVLGRQRAEYDKLYSGLRLFLRLGLAAQMIEYGMTKVIPVQFPEPSLITLVTPTGNVPLQGLLWTAVGAAPGYQMFTGWAELLAGLLLLFPRTTAAGALIALADLSQVFALNMTYDIGVKQLSFHLILITVFVLAADARRLAWFFWGHPVSPLAREGLFEKPRARRMAFLGQVVLGVYILGMQANANWQSWHAEGGDSPKSALYGIWNVAELSIDGAVRPARLNDYDRQWRRVVFDEPEKMVFQRVDDSFARYGVSLDTAARTLLLSKGESVNWRSTFTFERPAEDQIILKGEMDGHDIQMKLQRLEFDTLRVLNSTFRWLRPAE
jgi:hypothetical protein